MSHTPGPWEAHGWSIYGLDGMPIAQAATSTLADTLPASDWREFNLDAERDEHEASDNARLIAAAPEMLALVQRVSRLNGHCNPEGAAEEARAILAKIDGAS